MQQGKIDRVFVISRSIFVNSLAHSIVEHILQE